MPNHSVNAASLINFEPVDGKFPDGSVAVDNMPITDQFSSLGVTFGIDRNLDGLPDAGLFPRLEAVGNSDPVPGFLFTKRGGYDIAAPGFENRLGSFFLRGVGSIANGGESLLISYTSPTKAASAEIWDIDVHRGGRFEQWEVQALGADLSAIDSIASPAGTTFALDASPWLWSFDRLETDIHAIRLVYTGNSRGVGLAFDNFSPLAVEGSEPEPNTSVPEPASAIGLLIFGAVAYSLRKGK
ncbi:MAG: PEP-CTERM sorting domain-containing protein [Cyanobacteriota bacterium]|nr:PEP-CTERM sorting domain-containing protein [Cyanobacteriota bacterium]